MNSSRGPEPSASPHASEPEGSSSAGVAKHSLVIAGHRTSVSLERAFWEALKTAAAEDGCSLAALVARVDAGRGEANLSSALRVFALERAQTKARAPTAA
ncbi:MAG: arylsulfate sulfotransferase [Methylocystaceae bacterium]|nr:MAG: arylsulfate sulfotransferase [Methylocystaceae bacterium]